MVSHIKKFLRKFLGISFALITIASIAFYVPKATYASGSLEEQLQELQRQLEEIRKKQKDLQSQISAENSTQSALQSQINTYNNSIYQTELLIEESTKQIELFTMQIDLLAEGIANTEQQIDATKAQITDRYDHLNDVSFSLYKSNQVSTVDKLLQGNPVDESMYRTHFYDQSRQQAQALIGELEALKADQEAQKAELESQKEQNQTLKTDLENQKLLLETQKAGLDVQKSERQELLSASEGKEKELASQQKEIAKKAAQLESEMEAIEIELLSRVQNGTHVERGQTIAKVGRTGHVETYGDNPRTPEIRYGWYYPHSTEQPKAAAHLHFKTYLNGSNVNPLNHISSDRLADPLPGHILSQGYKSSHKALDMVYSGGASNTYGKLIKASCSGTVTYHTSYFDADDLGFPGGPFPRDDAHFYQLTCDANGPQAGYTVFGWHIQ